MRRWIGVAVVGALLASPALAGKKKGKDKKGDAPDPEPLVEETAPPEVVAAAVDPASLPRLDLPCGYEAGRTERYRLEKRSREQVPGLDEQLAGASTSEVTLTVVSVEGPAVVVELQYDKTELGSTAGDPVSQALTEKLSQVLVGKPVRLQVDNAQHTLRIDNIDEVSGMFRAVVDETVTLLQEQGQALPEEAVTMLRQMVADPELVAASVLEDVRPLFDYTCGPYPVGTLPYDVPLENPLGGNPLPGDGKATLHEPVDGVARFEATETLDEAGTAEVLKAMLPPDVPMDVGALGVASETTLTVEVDVADGWVRSWTHERTVGAMGRSQTDSVQMTRIGG
jgi:hypothetical protein